MNIAWHEDWIVMKAREEQLMGVSVSKLWHMPGLSSRERETSFSVSTDWDRAAPPSFYPSSAVAE